jgi:hypothetical protein
MVFSAVSGFRFRLFVHRFSVQVSDLRFNSQCERRVFLSPSNCWYEGA